MKKVFSFAVVAVLGICSSYAGEVIVTEGGMSTFLTPAPQSSANAVCFIYPNNDYKCACRFSDNSKIWASGELDQIQGLSIDIKSGNIKGCER